MSVQNVNSTSLDKTPPFQSLPDHGTPDAAGEGRTKQGDLDELLDYQPVPPRHVVTTLMRYRQVGRGRPLPYHLEEDGAE
jgi:hypothetical protein